MFFNSKEARDTFNAQPRAQTNPQSATFTQLEFTAANEAQFIAHAGVRSPIIIDTFRYLMFKVKKGIYVRYEGGKLACFLPFSNPYFVNDWAQNVKKPAEKLPDCRPDISEWYTNNGLMRYEDPYVEHDTNVPIIQDMFEELARLRDVADREFFINKRDYPVLNRDHTEPYFHIWNSFNHPLVSMEFAAYAPILSMCVNKERNEDILIPSYQDWGRANPQRFYLRGATDFDQLPSLITEWKNKVETKAVWRGTSTGPYVDEIRNQRLALCLHAQKHPEKYDVGFTKWNTRARKVMGDSTVQLLIPPKSLSIVSKKTMKEQSQHKYIIHVDGHTAANRLGHELLYGSVILKVRSQFDWVTWVTDRPHLPLIEVASDLSDLDSTLDWCTTHDEECRKLGESARKFALNLDASSILDALGEIVSKLPVFPSMEHHYPAPVVFWPSGENSRGILMARDRVGKYVEVKNRLMDCGYPVISERIPVMKNRTDVFAVSWWGSKFLLKQAASEAELYWGKKLSGEMVKGGKLAGIGNFVFTYGRCEGENSAVVQELVEGYSFYTWLKSGDFNFVDAMRFLVHTLIALHHLHEVLGWKHGDSTCWNIILKQEGKFQTFKYGAQAISSEVIPVLIDYERMGHIESDEDRANDGLMVFMTVLNTILNLKRLQKEELGKVFHIVNSMSGTRYLVEKCTSVATLRRFLARSAHFNNLCTAPKHEVGRWTSLKMAQIICECMGFPRL